MSGDAVAMLIGTLAALFLAVRALRGEGLTFGRKATMAAVWVVVIAALAVVLQRLGP